MMRRLQDPGTERSPEGAYHEAMEAAAHYLEMATMETKNRYSCGSSSANLCSNHTNTSCSSTAPTYTTNTTASSINNSDDVDYSSDIDDASSGLNSSSSTNSLDDRGEDDKQAKINSNTSRRGSNSTTMVDNTPGLSSLSSVSGPSSFKDDTSCSSLSGSGSDLDDEIDFLEQKRRILKRASDAMKREEVYNACHARSILSNGGRFNPNGSNLWTEAKVLLEDLKTETTLEKHKMSPLSLSLCQGDETMNNDVRHIVVNDDRDILRMDDLCLPAQKKRPKIDVSTVSKLSSKDVCPSLDSLLESNMDNGPAKMRDLTTSQRSTVESILHVPSTGHWMAKAMVLQIPALADPSSKSPNESLDVYLDPIFGPMVVSPSHVPFQNALRLADALEFTPSAQIITMSTPPFSIVHVNKAFCTMSGFSHEQVIGRPVESIIQIIQKIPNHPQQQQSSEPDGTNMDNECLRLKGRFVHDTSMTDDDNDDGTGAEHRHRRDSVSWMCEIGVAPITDQTQNMRGMSHVLVTVGQIQTKRSRTDNTAADNDDGSSSSSSAIVNSTDMEDGSSRRVSNSTTRSNSTKAKTEDHNQNNHHPTSSTTPSEMSSHRVFGTVG